MMKLSLYIGRGPVYESVIVEQGELEAVVRRVAAAIALEADRTESLVRQVLICDKAAGFSLREGELLVHCSYSNSYLEAAMERLHTTKK